MLDVTAFAGKDIEVNLSGADGKILFVKNYTHVSSTIKLALTNIKAGVYYLKAGDKTNYQLLNWQLQNKSGYHYNTGMTARRRLSCFINYTSAY